MTTNNHPANGPVSLERLHQIRETLSKAAAQSDGGNIGYAMADAVKVIDGAIASFGTEPVAWLLSGGGAKNHVSFDSGNAYADPLREVTPLYTATPAPASVPAAMEMDDDFDSAFEHGKAVGWNAFRAAILQGAEPVTTAYKLRYAVETIRNSGIEINAEKIFAERDALNSPVIPDGWVACVERMPSAGEKVLAYRPDAPESNDPLIKMATYVGGSAHGHGFDCYCKPTHWMPLPAAPKQEVNNG
ncbi:DUF551 domain-containing protein [Citrobacter freundii]|uniref:DUF551 domain-containing protein n=1 Tax=Citrobacter freundii TaxID=546 RepID=UPI003510AFEB